MAHWCSSWATSNTPFRSKYTVVACSILWTMKVGRPIVAWSHPIVCRPRLRGALNGARRNVEGVISMRCQAVSSDGDYPDDLNQLHTALKKAVDAEDYTAAASLRDAIQSVLSKLPGASSDGPGDWSQLGILDWLVDRVQHLGYGIPTPIQSRSCAAIGSRSDCIIQAPTGSGKTLAFLLPLLSLLGYPPDVYPDDLKGPQLVIIAPTRDLGVQIAMQVYSLFGGSTNAGIPGAPGNMFQFKGPRGLKVKGLVLDHEVEEAVTNRYLDGAHVVVGTPKLIAAALGRGVEVVQHCVSLCVDEADACYTLFPEDMDYIIHTCTTRETTSNLKEERHKQSGAARPTVVLSGATISDSLLSHAREQKWLDDPIDIVVGERSMLSSTVKHTYVVVDHEVDKLGVLCRCVLADQKLQNIDSQPNRGIVYVKEPENARALAEPLRNILWGKHAISVLLPDGSEPIQALHAFRDNKTSLLIASSYSSRGLDLPAVTHVYSTFLPKDESEYLHMTGRMGRIGSSNAGVITTLLLRNQVEQYKRMLNSLGGPQPTEIIPPMPRTVSDISDSVDEETIEDAKRSLETILALSPDEE